MRQLKKIIFHLSVDYELPYHQLLRAEITDNFYNFYLLTRQVDFDQWDIHTKKLYSKN